MDKVLRILALEDDPADAELIAQALRRSGLRFSMGRVGDKAAYLQALQGPAPDLLLIDYDLASINGLEALELAREILPEVPFIFVSGSLGEESAIETLKKGATDYVLKTRLSRLAPAVRRALEEAALRAERNKAEAGLRRMHFALEHTSEAVFLVGRDARFRYANPAASQHLGYSAEELLALSLPDVNLDLPYERWQPHWLDLSREGTRRFEARHRTKDGRIVPVEISMSLAACEGEEFLFAFVLDISERARLRELEKEARAQEEAASRAKDQFLALVSHELRTPITAILGWNWLLRSGELSAAERKRGFDAIERNVHLERRIVDDLLDASSLARGRLTIRRQVLDLGQLAAETAAGFAGPMRDKSLRLICAPEEGLLVDGDPGRLRQAIGNILSNAVKFSPEKGTVTVSVRADAGTARLSVEDTGPGISPAFTPHVFELFRQQEESLSRAHNGLGLGLALVKSLVELHGGSVEVAPPAPGQGARVTLVLPLAPAGEAPAVRSEPPARSPGFLRGVRVLVVDDDDDIRSVLLSVLEHGGARAQGAASAAEGFAAFGRIKPQVLVCDVAMPAEDGLSLLRRIRGLRPQAGGKVPAAALTSCATAEERTEALLAGFQICLPKPVDPEELLTVVGSLAPKPGVRRR